MTRKSELKTNNLYEALPTVAVQFKLNELQQVIQNPNSTQLQIRFAKKLIDRLKQQR